MPSLIWLVPLIAAVIGISLLVNALRNRGPEIEVSFRSADGLEAGRTALKYKDMQIGMVKRLTLAKDRSHVRAVLQLNQDAEGFTAKDTRFWVVRPRLDTSGISGLGTLLSGAYIGTDAGLSTEDAKAFTGLEVPPIVTHDASGKQFELRAKDVGSVDVGSPVYFRRIKVGQVAAFQLDEDGRGVTLRVFVNAPYDRFVGANTRFWHASGFDMQLTASGLSVHTQSLAAIVLGGIAFRAPEDDNGPVSPENTVFALADDESAAMKAPDGPAHNVLLYFNQSLRGLAPGAAVDFRGIVIGEVKSIGIEFDRSRREFRMPVLVQIYPARLQQGVASVSAGPDRSPAEIRSVLVSKGLRAQLRSGNLLTGQLFVAFDFFPKAPAVKIDVTKTPLELPTVVTPSLDDLQSQVLDIVAKVNKVPFEEIGKDVRSTMASLRQTLAGAEQLTRTLNNDVSPEILAAMKDARRTLDSTEKTLAQDSPLQQDMQETLRELGRTAASVRVLTDYLSRHPESLLRGKPPS